MEEATGNNNDSPLVVAGKFFWELVKVFLLALAIIIPIRYFLVQPFFVRGASMEPSFEDGEYLIIDELSYRFREEKRGEVVVFKFPDNPSQYYIKRIVGLPGETVEIDQGQVIIYNGVYSEGVLLDESTYLPEGLRTGGEVKVTLGEDEFFVMGDNRSASSDSRSWGALEKESIVGRVWIRAFPLDEVEIVSTNRPGFLSL